MGARVEREGWQARNSLILTTAVLRWEYMEKLRFPASESLEFYQNLMREIYNPPGDRHFDTADLLVQQQRFTMRALKGIRKSDSVKLKKNLMIAFCWSMAIPNRFKFNVADLVWNRFPYKCSYCGGKPCECKAVKPAKRVRIRKDENKRPKRISDTAKMFAEIYPPKSRSLEHAGVHLAEEMGEVSEAVHAYMSEHKKRQLEEVKNEVADYLSCVFGLANSAGIDLAKESSKMFSNGCHICHKHPCACTVAFINNLKT
jgi:NTP pyrophosphatase (non-canonical NTP hydrolase)